MKFYVLCDIEGVASLSCWDEARSANSCYAPMAREMTLEAAAAARGLFSAGADEVIIEDGHGDGCNIDCALLPKGARLLRGVTHDIVGLTGIFDESYDGMLMVGFHDAASASGNPTSHTMVSSRIFRLMVNGALWGEFEVSAHAAAYRGVPTLFASGDEGLCAAAARAVPASSPCPPSPAMAMVSLQRPRNSFRRRSKAWRPGLWRPQRPPSPRSFPITSMWRSPICTIMTPMGAPTTPAPASSLPPLWPSMPTITATYFAFSTL